MYARWRVGAVNRPTLIGETPVTAEEAKLTWAIIAVVCSEAIRGGPKGIPGFARVSSDFMATARAANGHWQKKKERNECQRAVKVGRYICLSSASMGMVRIKRTIHTHYDIGVRASNEATLCTPAEKRVWEILVLDEVERVWTVLWHIAVKVWLLT